MDEHVLALPFGLPGGVDARLARHLADEDWAAALTLLRDVVDATCTNPKWLLLLAYARFRDVSEVMVEELGDGSREALSLLHRAMAQGAPHEAVAPLLEAVEGALDEATREELRLAALLPAGGDASGVDPEAVEAYAFLLWRSEPARAAALFEAHAVAVPGGALVSRAQAALCLAEAWPVTSEVKVALERALAGDWTPHRRDRTVLEAVATQLLLLATGVEFEVLWRTAEKKSAAFDLPFPSVWPNQERLLARCLELGEHQRAKALAARIEGTRVEVSRSLEELLRRTRVDVV
jgi:hypothetical protein